MKYNLFLKIIVFSVASMWVVSCGSVKNTASKSSSKTKSAVKTENLRKLDSDFDGKISPSAKRIIKDAENFLGSPYKFAGNTADGLDCSGLTTKVFDENGLKLPRRSSEQADFGTKINISDAKPGDLLFFATAGGSKVSHVGIVHTVENDGEVKFIHASTSKGVIISSLNEKYWNRAYLHAQRVL